MDMKNIDLSSGYSIELKRKIFIDILFLNEYFYSIRNQEVEFINHNDLFSYKIEGIICV